MRSCLLACMVVLSTPASSWAAGAKFYFQIHEVQAGKEADEALKQFAREALQAEMKSRPEFTDDLGGAQGDEAMFAEIKKRKLKAFKVSLRLDKLARQVKEPKPGGRLKRVEVGVKLSVFGTTLPGEKLAFSGDGEAGLESEVAERAIDKEGLSMTKDAMKDALKQAVAQAVTKLSLPVSAPVNEGKRGKGKKK